MSKSKVLDGSQPSTLVLHVLQVELLSFMLHAVLVVVVMRCVIYGGFEHSDVISSRLCLRPTGK